MVKSRWIAFYSFLAIVALLVGAGVSVRAQQVFGSIIGTVTDPSGSAVNNAKVTVTETTKGTSFTTNTNESGNYTKGQLIPGTYQVTIEAPGFQKVVSSLITVQVDQAAQFNAAMQVGEVSQQVEVTAAAPLLQTDRADIAQTFSAQQLSELPQIGRNLQSFELLSPGTIKMPWQHAADEDPQGSVQTVVNGQLFSATGYELDGTVNQDPILGIIVVNPTFDSVNEVKMSNQDFDAEFEYTGGGLMTFSTKSGTNQLHGDAFESLQLNTPGFNDYARNPFSENSGSGAPTQHYNQFGGSIAGRIIKDKLFFFGDAQLTRNHIGGSVLTTTPTAAERTGNLSDWLQASPGYPGCLTSATGCLYQIYDPATGVNGVGRTPFPGNIIPAARIAANPQAQALLNFLPLPNTNASGTVYQNNFAGSGVDINTANQWNTRWDYYGNEKNTFFGRYSYGGYTLTAPGAFGLEAGGPSFNVLRYGGDSSSLNQSVATGWTHTASPTLINEMRVGYMRYHVEDVPNGINTTPAADAGIPGLNVNGITGGMPGFNINENGDTGAGGGTKPGSIQLGYALNTNGCNCPLTQLERQYQFVDNLSKIHGNHTFKFGADIRYAQNLRVPSDSHRAGILGFDPGGTGIVPASGGSAVNGLGLATFLLGDVSAFQRYYSQTTNAQESQRRWFFYGQDEWRVTPKLTFTYGLRWELIFPEKINLAGLGAEANLNTGQIDVFGIGSIQNHGYQAMNYHNFAPRAGLAYQISPKTVVRGGYGWSYNLGTFGSTFGHNITQNPPVLINQNVTNSNVCGSNFCDVFTLAGGPPVPTIPATNPDGTISLINSINPNNNSLGAVKTRPPIFTMPVVYLFNFSVQHQLTSKISVQGSYVGNRTRHGFLGAGSNTVNINEPLFIPGNTNSNAGRPYNGVLGPRYDYGFTNDVNDYCNCANASYNSFQALFKVNAAAGYTLQGNYTYQVSKADSGTSTYDQSYYFLYDRAAGWGNIDWLPHQQWTFAQNYEIPFGRGRKYGSNMNRFVDAALGGWIIAGITQYYSGVPFSPTMDSYPGRPNTGPNNRPSIGSGSPYAGATGDRNQWFVGCPAGVCTSGPFVNPAPNTFGNYPINTLIGPHFISQDASLMKVFSITERFKFTLRADATNVFNHTNLGLPNQDVQSSTVGQITGTAFGNGYLMRRIQYTGSITW